METDGAVQDQLRKQVDHQVDEGSSESSSIKQVKRTASDKLGEEDVPNKRTE